MTEQKSNSKYFYLCQFIGWGCMALFNFTIQDLAGVDYKNTIINALAIFIGGLFFTSLFRYLLKKNNWQDWLPLKLIIISFVGVVFTTLLWTALVFLITSFISEEKTITPIAFFASSISLGMIVVIWTLIYFSYQFIRRYHFDKIKRLQLEAEVQKAQLGTLKSQINPHFMFNTLNNIKALMLEDVEQARIMLTNFSELFSYSLQHSEKKEVLLEEELEVLGKYFDLIKIQYEEKLDYEINVEQGLEDELIPPMILQLLVENSIKHGISQEINGGEVFVNISRNKNELFIQVKNTGSLLRKNKLEGTLGIGQKNIKERLDLIYGNKASMKMKEEAPFVIVEIKIIK